MLTVEEKGARKVASPALAHESPHLFYMHSSARPFCQALVVSAPILRDLCREFAEWLATGSSPIAVGAIHGLPTTERSWRPATTTWSLCFRPSRAAPVTASSSSWPKSARRGRAVLGMTLCQPTHLGALLPYRNRRRRRTIWAGTVYILETLSSRAETGSAHRQER